MGKYFGTDGFRGEVGRQLTTEHAFAIGRFMGHHLQGDHRPRVLIGKDTRRSSYTLEYGLIAGLTASGAEAHLVHVLPTPGVSYLVQTQGFDCGIMISASHNRFSDNGIKIFAQNGAKLDDDTTALLETFLDGGRTLPSAQGTDIGTAVDAGPMGERYMTHLRQSVQGDLKGLRVGLDCANGSASRLGEMLFRNLGATVFPLHCTPDGVNINRSCGSTHPESLQRLVVEKGLDVGFALDGDADRCIAVDHAGRVVDGDGILYVMGQYLKAAGRLKHNTVITTVMSNMGLYQALDALDITYESTPVGDRFVHERMVQTDCVLGGEQSGHIIFGEYADTGDGLLTALLIAERICRSGKSLQQLTAGFHPYPQLTKTCYVSNREMVMADPAVLQVVQEAAVALAGKGRVLARASGTEPAVRLTVEAPDGAFCRKIVERMAEILQQRGFLSDADH